MTKPLDEDYLIWLYYQVIPPSALTPSETYWKLFRQLYCKEFIWIVPNDDNRIADGRDLRLEFLNEKGIKEHDALWLNLGCSMLEMLIALSRRLVFEVEGTVDEWFWVLMGNVHFRPATDHNYNDDMRVYIDEMLDQIIWRTYSYDGRGGLFPLTDPVHDQRRVEIWYQLSAYLLERL